MLVGLQGRSEVTSLTCKIFIQYKAKVCDVVYPRTNRGNPTVSLLKHLDNSIVTLRLMQHVRTAMTETSITVMYVITYYTFKLLFNSFCQVFRCTLFPLFYMDTSDKLLNY